jgi:hypothetical protein
MQNKKVYHVWVEFTNYSVVSSMEEAKALKERMEEFGFIVEIVECWEVVD